MLWRKDIVCVRTAAIQEKLPNLLQTQVTSKDIRTNKEIKLTPWLIFFLSSWVGTWTTTWICSWTCHKAQLGSAVALLLGFTLKGRCTTSSRDNTSTVQLSPCFSEEDLMPPSEHWVTGFCLWAFVSLFNSSVWRDQYSPLDRGPASTQPWIFTLHKWDETHCRCNSYFKASAKD